MIKSCQWQPGLGGCDCKVNVILMKSKVFVRHIPYFIEFENNNLLQLTYPDFGT